jgi:hypothetical protein
LDDARPLCVSPNGKFFHQLSEQSDRRFSPGKFFRQFLTDHTLLPQRKPRDEYHLQLRVPMPNMHNFACAMAKFEKNSTG